MAGQRNKPPAFSDNDNLVAKTRRSLGIKQEDMAKLLRLTTGAISHLETGRCKASGPTAIVCELLLLDPDILKRLEQ